MKIFLLAITIILLIYRIKGTPRMLSKSIYEKEVQKTINKSNKTPLDNNSEEVMKGFTIIFAFLLELFIFIYYIMVGCKLNNSYISILSALEAATVFISFGMLIKECDMMFSNNVKDFEFHRLYWLFNVILDYVFYPSTIYMLLNY